MVNLYNFRIDWKDIPELPCEFSEEARAWWIEQKRRCIEGYWSGGRWMPGNLYFFYNFWQILLHKYSYSKVGTLGRPECWDIHWEIFYSWMEARGLAGFTGQPEVVALKDAMDNRELTPEIEVELRSKITPIRDVLYNTTKDLGSPLFLNEAKNLMILGNRGSSKSYSSAGGVIAHEWLFDGLKEYKPGNEVDEASVILVGAGESRFSSDLLDKVKLGLDHLPGGKKMHDKYYPSPFSKQYKGNFVTNTDFEAVYMKKIGGNWVNAGTGSVIKHRTFKDNPFAGSGIRAPVEVLEEIGIFDNLLLSHGALIDTMKDGQYKFGSGFYTGTGGDMDSGTIAANTICYAPETFDMIFFEDKWENKGKIIYFIPATRGTKQYKDKHGVTNEDRAKKHFEAERERIKKGKNAQVALDLHVQNQPLVPSEMFLSKTGNIFPKAELQAWLSIIESNPKFLDSEWVGELLYNEEGELKWHQLEQDRAIRVFPHNPTKDDIRGAITVWEHPVKINGKVPQGLYVAGTDPYDHDESGTMSLGSTFIYKKILKGGDTQEFPVAEYTGRHERGSDAHYEIARRLLLYYNAKNMHENNLIGFYKYFERKNSSYLLMEAPEYAKEILGSQPNRPRGIHMGNAQIVHGELLIRDWLIEEYEPGKLSLTKLRSVPLIKELIGYYRKSGKKKGAFDRVRSFMCAMYAVQETYRIAVEHPDRAPKIDPFFARQAIFQERAKEKESKTQLLNLDIRN